MEKWGLSKEEVGVECGWGTGKGGSPEAVKSSVLCLPGNLSLWVPSPPLKSVTRWRPSHRSYPQSILTVKMRSSSLFLCEEGEGTECMNTSHVFTFVKTFRSFDESASLKFQVFSPKIRYGKNFLKIWPYYEIFL